MGVVKRSVSFEAGVWEDLEREVGAGSVSSLVNDALAQYLRRERGLSAIAAYEAEHGAFNDTELAEADRLLDAAGVVDLRVADLAESRKKLPAKKSSTARKATRSDRPRA
jgi:hypothetical protein